MAVHAPITGAPLRASLLPHFQLLSRPEIEQAIERLIAMLDAADGDCDLEDDDPAGDPLDRGEAEGHFGMGLSPNRPVWPVDQRNGPINYAAAGTEHRA